MKTKIHRLLLQYPRTADLFLLLVVGGTVLFSFLGQNGNWASREIRHAEIMREMAETGDYLIPHLMGKVYYDKPPVMHFLGATLMRISGAPNLFHARFPSALAAFVSLFAVYGIGRMLGGGKVGRWAALLLLAMPGFWIMARVARPDLTLVALILISCFFLGCGMRTPGGSGKAGWLIVSGVASALAVITKGPYGLMGPLLFLAFAPRENAELHRPRWPFAWFGAGWVITIAAWCLPIYLRDGGDYLRGVIFQENLATGGGTGHFEPFYWYLGSGFLQSLPVILFLPLAYRQWRREKRFPAALAIAAVILFIISCVPGKRRHYLLPLLPFLALGLARGLAGLAPGQHVLRGLAVAAIVASLAADPLYYGPILQRLRPRGDSEYYFITDVDKLVPPGAPVVCFGVMGEYLAWVRRDYHGIINVRTVEEAETALRLGNHDRYLVASAGSLKALNEDPDLALLYAVMSHPIKRQGTWLLAIFVK